MNKKAVIAAMLGFALITGCGKHSARTSTAQHSEQVGSSGGSGDIQKDDKQLLKEFFSDAEKFTVSPPFSYFKQDGSDEALCFGGKKELGPKMFSFISRVNAEKPSFIMMHVPGSPEARELILKEKSPVLYSASENMTILRADQLDREGFNKGNFIITLDGVAIMLKIDRNPPP
jgi:hypothetical protein